MLASDTVIKYSKPLTAQKGFRRGKLENRSIEREKKTAHWNGC